MNDIIQAIKDIFGAAISLGWQPWPTIIATAMMLVARSIWEPDILAVTTPDQLSDLGKRKALIFFGVFVGSLIVHIGIARPANAWDWCTSVGFCIGHTMFAYVISSSSKVKGLIKNGFDKAVEKVAP